MKYRSAVTGEYVTEEYAIENPDTTVSEQDLEEEEAELLPPKEFSSPPDI